MLLRQEVFRACSRAWAKTGKRIAARIAMIAITTSNSIKVKPRFLGSVLIIDRILSVPPGTPTRGRATEPLLPDCLLGHRTTRNEPAANNLWRAIHPVNERF